MEKETIKKAIVKEINDYHSKYPRPKLTPLATKFFPKPIKIKDDEVSPELASKISYFVSFFLIFGTCFCTPKLLFYTLLKRSRMIQNFR